MLEIYSKDAGKYFEFFELDVEKKSIIYKTRDYNDITIDDMYTYKSYREGTVLMDGEPVDSYNATEEQYEYIKSLVSLYEEKYNQFKETYQPSTIKKINLFRNKNSELIIYEGPNYEQFYQCVYITAFEYLKDFLFRYEKVQKEKENQWRKRIAKIINKFNKNAKN